MTFFKSFQKTLKAGLYVDYYFKTIVFFLFKKIFQSNFFIILEKFISEELFYSLKRSYSTLLFVIESVKKSNTLTLLKILFFISLQILILVIL